jgi:Domain of unknown function (DUF4112)
MYTNLAIDFGIGLVPVLGDFADAWFKCNTRNNMLLERYLREKGQKHPVAPAPAAPKQSGLRRFFGSEPHDTRTNGQGTEMVDREGVRNGVDVRERDLEAQNEDMIHYTRH